MCRCLVAVAVIFASAAHASAQKVGDIVIVIDDSAPEKEADPKDSDAPAAVAPAVARPRSTLGQVTEIKDDQLRINDEWVPKEKVLELAAAEKHFASALEKGADDFESLELLAEIHGWQERWDAAIAEYGKLIKHAPSEASGYLSRSDMYWKKGEVAKALDDAIRAVAVDQKNFYAFTVRGTAYAANKRYQEALEDFNEAIQLASDDEVARAGRAWFLSTCPDEKFRFGNQALSDAKKACEGSKYSQSYSLEALAAAEAETGNFPDAIRWQKKALELAPTPLKEGPEKRLKLYQAGKPYREQPGDWK